MAAEGSNEEESPLIYGIEYQSRALCSQCVNLKDSMSVRFLVGTQSLKKENQIHLIEYLEECNSLSKAVFRHGDGEVWHIATHFKNSNLLTTCYSSQSSTHEQRIVNNCSLWKYPIDVSNNIIDEDQTITSPLQKICDFKSSNDVLVGRTCIWHPEEGNQLITEEDKKLLLWDVETHKLMSSFSIDAGKGSKFSKINTFRWSPHSSCSLLGVAIGCNVYGKDIRCKSNSNTSNVWSLNAHSQLVRDLDFNPNAQYYIATCGDDCQYKFWDVRNPSSPALTMYNHSHWVWSIRYNQFHDQLVLSCSSDSRVILSRITSLASQPYGHLLDLDENDEIMSDDQNAASKGMPDGVIATFEEHEDSVYAVEWSTSDPWIFASLSYDGRLVINKVPKKEKINILF
ncbi:protein TSSC1-like protein [Dinothrombium tinctorium]|uniref:Protein TSSC1-like protein n=1 Tax=Dinothrombium tinctorium TaxID=1965070 RepID=A0A3S3SGE7_9ACAR|nr:protein TSSC1-like protein [Dinothrombium tinctorium]